MHGARFRIPVAFHWDDPTADDVRLVARVPKSAGKYTLVGASAAISETKAADASNGIALKLRKRGVDGAATAVDLTNNLGEASGGTHPVWTSNVPKDFTIVETADANVLIEGEVIELVYDESGTVAPGTISGFLEFVHGVATS